MSLASMASLGSLRLESQQRASMENNPSVTVPEWNNYITKSVKELWDILIAAYGSDYYVATPYQFQVTGANFYSLPADFYKLLGVDLQYSMSPTGWITLKRFEFIDRNKANYLNSAFTISANAQAWYIPNPPSLQFQPICSTTISSTTIGVSNSADLIVGMNVYGNGIQPNTTIVSINTLSNTIVVSKTATVTQAVVILQMWTDAAQIDGIAGWEEYVIIDAAIKAGIKQENQITELRTQKEEMKARIEAMADARDVGQAQHSSDALSVNGFGYGVTGVGLNNIRYRLTGSQLQFAAISDDTSNSYGGGY
jgi:hypothetical protein